MRARQIADPQAERTAKLGHAEEECERMRARRETLRVCAYESMYVYEEFSDTQRGYYWSYRSIISWGLACWGVQLAGALGQFLGWPN